MTPDEFEAYCLMKDADYQTQWCQNCQTIHESSLMEPYGECRQEKWSEGDLWWDGVRVVTPYPGEWRYIPF